MDRIRSEPFHLALIIQNVLWRLRVIYLRVITSAACDWMIEVLDSLQRRLCLCSEPLSFLLMWRVCGKQAQNNWLTGWLAGGVGGGGCSILGSEEAPLLHSCCPALWLSCLLSGCSPLGTCARRALHASPPVKPELCLQPPASPCSLGYFYSSSGYFCWTHTTASLLAWSCSHVCAWVCAHAG